VSAADEVTLTVMAHDSFALPDDVIEAFESEHGARLEILRAGDAGSMVNQAILTADRPLADVLCSSSVGVKPASGQSTSDARRAAGSSGSPGLDIPATLSGCRVTRRLVRFRC
jgi:ABC-type thiamine transport system substrate-binding protein